MSALLPKFLYFRSLHPVTWVRRPKPYKAHLASNFPWHVICTSISIFALHADWKINRGLRERTLLGQSGPFHSSLVLWCNTDVQKWVQIAGAQRTRRFHFRLAMLQKLEFRLPIIQYRANCREVLFPTSTVPIKRFPFNPKLPHISRQISGQTYVYIQKKYFNKRRYRVEISCFLPLLQASSAASKLQESKDNFYSFRGDLFFLWPSAYSSLFNSNGHLPSPSIHMAVLQSLCDLNRCLLLV